MGKLLFIKRWAGLAVLFTVLSVFAGCGHMEGLSVTTLPDGKATISRLAVLPFREIIPEDSAVKMVSCPVCGAVFYTEKHTDVSASVTAVENVFLERLREFRNFAIIAPESASEVSRSVTASPKSVSVEILKKAGSELGVDGILVGHVFRYRERKGYTYSVEKPASVAFDIHLFRVSDGIMVWRGAFDKTQSSLTEDLLQFFSFYKRGGKWVTARELADEGIAEMMKTFPGIR